MSKRIIIAVTNDLVTDQRVNRVAQTLTDQGYSIELVGRYLKYSQQVVRSYAVRRFRLSFNKGPLFYANYNICLFFYLLTHSFDAVLANDLDTLPACFLASKLKRKKLVYDSHELFTEVPELVNRKFQQNCWKWIEKRLVPKLQFAYTVCDSIANEYQQLYGTRFQVIRNVPYGRQPVFIDKKRSHYVLIYQGALNIGRGIELMITTLQYLPTTDLWIIGKGDIDDDLIYLTNRLNLSSRVRFFGRVPFDELVNLTCQADLGLSLEEDRGKNYRYALPNKLFDYIQARIPVLVSDLPEMRNIIDSYQVGQVCKNRKPEHLAEQIRLMLNTDVAVYSESLENAANGLCWEKEQLQLIGLFNKVFGL